MYVSVYVTFVFAIVIYTLVPAGLANDSRVLVKPALVTLYVLLAGDNEFGKATVETYTDTYL
jgi:hypothetical protein